MTGQTQTQVLEDAANNVHESRELSQEINHLVQTEIAAMVHTESLSLLSGNGHSVRFVQVRESLPSKVAAISPFVDQLMRFISEVSKGGWK